LKKLLASVMICMMAAVLTGCEGLITAREDVENLDFIKVAGIDKKENKVRITAASKAAKGGGEGGPPEVEPNILISEGNTLLNAVRLQHTISNKRPFWGMTEHIIIGEDGAKYGLRSLTDFFMRDHESRLNMRVFVARGESAEKIIKGSANSKYFIGDRLESLEKRRGGYSMSTQVNLHELSRMLDSKTSSPYLPCIQVVSGVEQLGTKSDNNIMLIGLAVFKDDKLLYYLDGNETRGFNFIKGDVESGVIPVKDPAGQEISLEIITTGREIKTYINDGIPSVDMTIKMTTNIDEQWSAEDIYDEKTLNFLNSEQSEAIKSEVLNVIKKAQERNTDIFGLGDAIYHQHPGKWKDIEDKWEELFPKMKINVNVESKINRTYDIKEPNQYEKKGKKQ
jgi:spore germination protein KC